MEWRKKIPPPVIAFVALLGIAAACGDYQLGLPGFSPDDPGEVTISINPGAIQRGELAFGENPLVLERDTQVTWVNNDTVNHTVTAQSGAFDSGEILPNGTFAFTFTQSGAFDYHCRLHPTETGLIVIEATEPGPAVSPSPVAPGTIPPSGPLPSPIPIPSIPAPAPTILP